MIHECQKLIFEQVFDHADLRFRRTAEHAERCCGNVWKRSAGQPGIPLWRAAQLLACILFFYGGPLVKTTV